MPSNQDELAQVDPSPIEEGFESSSASLLDDSPNTAQPSGEPTSSSDEKVNKTKRPPTHGAPHLIYYLSRVQRYSTYMLGIFTTIHIANTSVVPLITGSVSASETYLLQAREIYQTPLTEPILITIPILTHIASGISLRFLRRSLNIQRYGDTHTLPSSQTSASIDVLSPRKTRVWPPLSAISISGYTFATFLGAHVLLNRALPLYIEGDSSNVGLAFVAHGFARHKAVAYVSYGGLLLSGCSHMVWGAARWLGLPISLKAVYGSNDEAQSRVSDVGKLARQRRRRIFYCTQALALGLTALWACGSFGIVARGGLTDGWVGELYDRLLSEIMT